MIELIHESGWPAWLQIAQFFFQMTALLQYNSGEDGNSSHQDRLVVNIVLSQRRRKWYSALEFELLDFGSWSKSSVCDSHHIKWKITYIFGSSHDVVSTYILYSNDGIDDIQQFRCHSYSGILIRQISRSLQ